MNYKSLLFIFSVFLILSCDDEQAAGPGDADTYIKFFGADHSDIAYVLRQTDDGGSILLGTIEIDNEGTDVFKIKVIKVDKNGNQLWQKVYPEFEVDPADPLSHPDYEYSLTGRSIIVVDDGYIIVGDSIKSDRPESRGSSLFLMKINDNATDNSFQFSALDYKGITGIDMPYDVQGVDIILDSDGNYRTISNVLDDGQVIGNIQNRISADLTFDLNCIYSVPSDFTIVKSLIENDNQEIVFGGTEFKASFNIPKLIISSCGDASGGGGDRLLDNPINHFFANQVISSSTGYAIVGTKETSTGNTDIFFALFDQNGAAKTNSIHLYDDVTYPAIDDNNTFAGIGTEDAEGFTITKTNDGGYMIAGSTLADTAGELDILLIKTDGRGNVQWTKVIGNANEEYATHIQQTSDGSYLIFGNTEFGGIDTMFLIKTDKNGNVN